MKTLIETQTPLVPDINKFIDSLLRLENLSGVVLEENGGIGAVWVADALRERFKKEIFLKITCRDRNRIALHSELTTAAAAGLTNLILADGTHPVRTRFPTAKPVYELDALLLLRMLRGFSQFGDEPGALGPVAWNVGVCIGDSTAADMKRAEKFLSAGADLFFVRSLDAVRKLRSLAEKPVILSVPQEEADDHSAIISEARAAGASGVSFTTASPERILDGTITQR